MKEKDIDDMLTRAGQTPQPCDPAALARIGDSIKSSMRPVRPLPPAWLITVGIVFVCAAIALAGAAHTGFFGIARMDPVERLIVFPALAILACLAAGSFVAQMTPASRLRVSPVALLALGIAALLVVFAILFRDYHTNNFVSAGVACLVAGLLHAIPAGLLSWLLLRRGFATRPVSAGLVAGTLAGLTGLGMLELHCANFQAAHILAWHVAVVPISAALGALLGWTFRAR